MDRKLENNGIGPLSPKMPRLTSINIALCAKETELDTRLLTFAAQSEMAAAELKMNTFRGKVIRETHYDERFWRHRSCNLIESEVSPMMTHNVTGAT